MKWHRELFISWLFEGRRICWSPDYPPVERTQGPCRAEESCRPRETPAALCALCRHRPSRPWEGAKERGPVEAARRSVSAWARVAVGARCPQQRSGGPFGRRRSGRGGEAAAEGPGWATAAGRWTRRQRCWADSGGATGDCAGASRLLHHIFHFIADITKLNFLCINKLHKKHKYKNNSNFDSNAYYLLQSI